MTPGLCFSTGLWQCPGAGLPGHPSLLHLGLCQPPNPAWSCAQNKFPAQETRLWSSTSQQRFGNRTFKNLQVKEGGKQSTPSPGITLLHFTTVLLKCFCFHLSSMSGAGRRGFVRSQGIPKGNACSKRSLLHPGGSG